MHTDRVEFLGVGFDLLSMEDLLERLDRVQASSPYEYIVTPNVDHVVRLNDANERPLRAPLYEGADYSLCDSRVLRQLAKPHGLELPLVPGSDLTVRILSQVVRHGDRIAIVGGDAALLQDLEHKFPHVHFVQHLPPMGLRHNAAARQEAAKFIASARARFSFITVGAPQQEMIAAAVRSYPGATGTAFCVGASLDFITGRQRRAPKVLQKLSLEWAYRLFAEPRRMWRRYLVEGPRIFLLAARYRKGSPAQ